MPDTGEVDENGDSMGIKALLSGTVPLYDLLSAAPAPGNVAGRYVATAGSPAEAQYDLLTAILHEQGHILGLAHGSSDLMNEYVHLSSRILPLTGSASVASESPLLENATASVVGNNITINAGPTDANLYFRVSGSGTLFIHGYGDTGVKVEDIENLTVNGPNTNIRFMNWGGPFNFESLQNLNVDAQHVRVYPGVEMNVYEGNVNFHSTGGTNDVGVWNQGTITATTGSVNFDGDAEGLDNVRAVVNDGSVITDSGSITMTGNGFRGVDNVGLIQTNTGNIDLTGQGGPSGDFAVGVTSSGEIITADGNINIYGVARQDENDNRINHGVSLVDNAGGDNGSKVIATGTGNITIYGKGSDGSTGWGNRGLNIRTDTVISTNSGDISLTGEGGAGSVDGQSQGISISGNTSVTSQTGDITIDGSGNSPATGSHGTNILSSTISTGAGDIYITGTNEGEGNSTEGVRVVGSTILTPEGNLTIHTDEINSIRNEFGGTGILTYMPLTEGQPITVGVDGRDNERSDIFQLATNETGNGTEDWTKIVIGDGTSEVGLGTSTFKSPVEINGTNLYGLEGANGANITAPSVNLNGGNVYPGGEGTIGTINSTIDPEGTFELSDTLHIDIAGLNSYDQLSIAGGGDIDLSGSSLSVDFLNGFASSPGDELTIVNNVDGSSVLPFSNAVEGQIYVDADGNKWRLSYAGGDGDDVTLTRVELPNAVDDEDAVQAATTGTTETSGSVTGNDFHDNETETVTVTEVGGQPVPEEGLVIPGKYGSLTIFPDGSYTYTLDNEDPDTQALGEGETVTESFDYLITDGAGENAGATLNVNVTGVNNPPVTEDITITVTSGEGGRPFSQTEFPFTDPDGDGFSAIVIESLPEIGTLTLNGQPVTVGQEISVEDLANLVYTPPAGAEVTTTSFDFSVVDSAGNKSEPATVNININADPSVVGDPHFYGHDGGFFDVQGVAGGMYNILSDKNIQYNAQFKAYAAYQGATVLGEIGITLASGDLIYADADGALQVNGVSLGFGDSAVIDNAQGRVEYNLMYKSRRGEFGQIIIETREYTIILHHRISLGVTYFDQGISVKDAYSDGVNPHGLWGQTVDPDDAPRNGDRGSFAQGGGAIDTVNSAGEVVRSSPGDKRSVNLYRVPSLFSTVGINDDTFFLYQSPDEAGDPISLETTATVSSAPEVHKFSSTGVATRHESAFYGSFTINPDGTYDYTVDESNADVASLEEGQQLREEIPYQVTYEDGTSEFKTLPLTLEKSTTGVTVLEMQSATEAFVNPGFEQNASSFTFYGYGLAFPSVNDIPGWDSTHPDTYGIVKPVEVWRSVNNGESVPAYEGGYFVELNAFVASGLFQTLKTTPGDVIRWSFAHRGRMQADTIKLKAGPNGGTLTDVTTETTGTDNWAVYSGLYLIPEGQTETTFFFESASATNGDASIGNFLDLVDIKPANFLPGAAPNAAGETTGEQYTLIDAIYELNLTGTYTHPLAGQVLSVDWGDGNIEVNDVTGNEIKLTHDYFVDGLYTILVDYGHDNDRYTLNVANGRAVLRKRESAVSQQTVTHTLDLAGVIGDAELAGQHKISVDWGDGVIRSYNINQIDLNNDLSNFTLTHDYADADATYEVRVTVTDDANRLSTNTYVVNTTQSTETDTLGSITADRVTLQSPQVLGDALIVEGSETGEAIHVSLDADAAGNPSALIEVDGHRSTEVPLSQFNELFINGQASDDTITVDDALYAHLSVVNLNGGAGNDTIYGGIGNDRILGGTGEDTLYGGGGNDVLYGQDGNDTLYGGDGRDKMSGGDGNDVLYGEADSDALSGGEGDDALYGGDGNDRLIDRAGVNAMDGGEGRNRIIQ